MSISTCLGIGAVISSIVGKKEFQVVNELFDDANTIGAVQVALLAVVTFGSLFYTTFKRTIHTL